MIYVKVGVVPGTVQEVSLGNDTTVGAALSAAGLLATGFCISVNGNPATVSDTLRDGARVTLTKAVKGN